MDHEERIQEAFNNLFWTRVYAVHQDSHQDNARYPLATDIIDSRNKVEEASDFLQLQFKVHYDPREFANDNPDP